MVDIVNVESGVIGFSQRPIDDPKQREIAEKNYQLRLAGTHVYHEELGVVELEVMDEHLASTPKKERDRERARFKGHPITGVIPRRDGGRVVVPDSPTAPSEVIAPTPTAPVAPSFPTAKDIADAVAQAMAQALKPQAPASSPAPPSSTEQKS
ncbi:MAG TPA: hypothetical protein VFF73_25180 [Planctomycetota bacterium]|nr:hypothetical protein [Planctomycetota bacterium]